MTVRVEFPAPAVAEIVMDRPEALNAVSSQQAREIAAASAKVAEDAAISVVILSSAVSKAFCVGADLKERNSFSDEDLKAQRPIARAAYDSVRNLPMPTIAAVDGYALGGGCELALACDLIVASESAVFALPEVGVGLIPGGGGTQLLARRIGWNRAADLIFTARRVELAEAARLGLIDRQVGAGNARRAALELAEAIAANSPVGLRNAKWALREGTGSPLGAGLEIEDQAWERTAFSPDRVEGIAAFNDHRLPRWPGLPGRPETRP